jgi:4-oxalocrotonate tautomerase
MPFANMKVPADTLSAEQKKHAVDAITDLYVEFYGEQARPNVMVLVDEVVDGGWGIGGQVLTTAMFNGH